MGRFSAEFAVTNEEDLWGAKRGLIQPSQVRRARICGIVDTGATRLVLPANVVADLGLPDTGQIAVAFADGRRAERRIAGNVRVEINGRSSVFFAVVEPGRKDALIGAIVLEELDLIPDCTRQILVPRDPRGIFTEIECVAT